MKKKFSHIIALLLFVCLFFSVKATHIIGGEMYYTQLDSVTYELTLKIYRDCYNGIPWFDEPASIKIFDSNNVYIRTYEMYNYTYAQLDPSLDTLCVTIPPNVCVQEAIYTDTIVLPIIPGGYQLSYARCCRNYSILNIVAPESTGITLHTVIPDNFVVQPFDTIPVEIITIDSTQINSIIIDTIRYDSVLVDTFFQFNSHPRFTNFPPILICAGQPLVFNHAATDPDGDSIVYSLCTPLRGGSVSSVFGFSPMEAPPFTPVSWNAPYTAQDPLGGVPLSIDVNGLLTGVPNTVGQFVVGVCATEFRNGVMLGVNRRDFQFNVSPCSPIPSASIPSNIQACVDSSNAVVFEVQGLVNTLTFDWNFGDLTTLADTSSLQIPTYSYPDTGNYIVQLIVNKGYSCADTGYATVSVQSSPKASFTFQNACFGNPVHLQSAAVANAGTIAGVEWLFGGGVTSNNVTENYSYGQAGVYTVSHIVTNTYGCVDTVSHNVQQYEKPVSDFVFDSVCVGSITNFTSTSQGIGIVDSFYEWQFGDGNSSVGVFSVSHQYVADGVYQATLVTENNNGCKDSILKSVTVMDLPQVDFVTSSGCINASIVLADASVSSFPVIQWAWSSDTIQQSFSAQNIVLSFPWSGVFDVQLHVENSFGCSDSITKTVTVYPNPVVDFTHTNVCLGDTIQFQNQTTVQGSIISSYQWSFGNEGGSSVVNPSHSFGQEGVKEVSLTVTSLEGCVDSVRKLVEVYYLPAVDFVTQLTCLNDSVRFSDVSTVVNDTIIDWSWDFNNGVVSVQSNPNIIYNSTGVYNVTLVATSSQGCSNFFTKAIEIFNSPQALFSVQNVCEGGVINLLDQSISVDNVVNWQWNIAGIDTAIQNVLGYLMPNSGSYAVVLTVATNNGCVDSVTNTVEVFANPVANFNFISDCASDFVEFVDSSYVSQGAVISWKWSFGDGIYAATQNATHIYPSLGDYTVQLFVETNNGCVDSVVYNVYNLSPTSASFSLTESRGCAPLTTSIFALNQDPTLEFYWEFSNGVVGVGAVVDVQFENPGSYGMKFVVTNLEGCSDSLEVGTLVEVYENPAADFQFLPNEASIYESGFQFENLSVGANSYQWLFGDGETSKENSPWHTYADTGVYPVSLIATTAFGCVDTVETPVRVNGNFFVYYVPNTFTPNQNSLNEFFNGKGIGVAEYQLFIYTRWGELIFETTNKNQGWNGEKEGVSCEIGTYIYLIKIKDVLGKYHKFIGHVNLVR